MEKKYNTNLASEFYVMSMLYRLGLDAYLTLGNKKGVDIVLRNPDGTSVSLEVKGVNKKTDDWPLSANEIDVSGDIFYIFISYESKIYDISIQPHLWIIPAKLVAENCKSSKTKTSQLYYMSHKKVREDFDKYKNNWAIFQNIKNSKQPELFIPKI